MQMGSIHSAIWWKVTLQLLQWQHCGNMIILACCRKSCNSIEARQTVWVDGLPWPQHWCTFCCWHCSWGTILQRLWHICIPLWSIVTWSHRMYSWTRMDTPKLQTSGYQSSRILTRVTFQSHKQEGHQIIWPQSCSMALAWMRGEWPLQLWRIHMDSRLHLILQFLD